MPTSARHIATMLTVALAGCGLAGCGTINEKLAGGISDAIPAAIGGMPADAPPRPGTAKYDEYIRERERKRHRMDGVFVVTLSEDGLCASFREWWNAREEGF